MITLAVPFYSNVAFLKKAVESALAQTSDKFRILISDDCGPDGPEAAKYASTLDPKKVSYVRQPKNLGLAGNWNYCMAAAQTPLVTLLHADDMLEPGYVEAMLKAAEEQPDAALIHCSARIVDAEGRDTFSFPDFYKKIVAPKTSGLSTISGDEGLAGLMKGCYIMCPTVCYRPALLGAHKFSATWKQVVDLDYYANVLFAGLKIIGIPESLYCYRRHGSNQTSLLTASLVRFEEEVALYNDIAARATKHGWSQTAEEAQRKSIIKKNLLYCITKDLLAFRAGPAQTKIRFLRAIS